MMDPIRIMIVEDEVIILTDLKVRMQRMGFIVCAEAASGEEAVCKARDEHPDLILMDIILKGRMNGLDAAKAIGRDLDVPIIFLSAQHESDLKELTGVSETPAFVSKPFLDTQILEAIGTALPPSKIHDQSQERFGRENGV